MGEPICAIHEIRSPVVDIACRRLPALREALLARADGEPFIFEVHQHLDAAHVRAISLHDTDGLKRGLPVYETDGPLAAVPAIPLPAPGESASAGSLLEDARRVSLRDPARSPL